MTAAGGFSITDISTSAANYLRRAPRKQQQGIAKAVDHLCGVSPFQHPNPATIRPLKGELKGLWRYQLGGIRIIYSVNKQARTIKIIAITPRGDAY